MADASVMPSVPRGNTNAPRDHDRREGRRPARRAHARRRPARLASRPERVGNNAAGWPRPLGQTDSPASARSPPHAVPIALPQGAHRHARRSRHVRARRSRERRSGRATSTATGKLTITYLGTENVELAGDPGGKVVLNGADTHDRRRRRQDDRGAREDAAGIGDNTVDLSGVNAAAYTQLTATTLLAAEGGDDASPAPSFADRIEGGKQDDTMSGKDGDDTLVWNNGEGTDDMYGGDGIDTIESNGADTALPRGRRDLHGRDVAGAPLPSSTRALSGGPFTLDVGGAETLRQQPARAATDKFSHARPDRAGHGHRRDAQRRRGQRRPDRHRRRPTRSTAARATTRSSASRATTPRTARTATTSSCGTPATAPTSSRATPATTPAQDNGGAAREHFVVTAQGQRVTATRDNLAPFFLDMGTSRRSTSTPTAATTASRSRTASARCIKVDANLGDGNDSIEARNDSADRSTARPAPTRPRSTRPTRSRTSRPSSAGRRHASAPGRRHGRSEGDFKSRRLKVDGATPPCGSAARGRVRRQGPGPHHPQRQGRRLAHDELAAGRRRPSRSRSSARRASRSRRTPTRSSARP